MKASLVVASLLFLALAGVAGGADQPSVRATLKFTKDRAPAPSFALKDSVGRLVELKSYRGKVVLLDFWATWCHGCKEEIPWFAGFQSKFAAKSFAVVGVSMDEGGWNVVQPFLAGAKVPYQILLGDDPTARQYGIQSLPGTFLIDRHGGIAATYIGLVDKDDIEVNLQALLAER